MKDLTKLSDNSLIENIRKDNCSDSTNELYNRVEKLILRVIHQFHKKYHEANLQDLLDDSYYIFNIALKSYRSDKKTKFSSWAAAQSRYHCLNTNKNHGKSVQMENKDIDIFNNKSNKFHLPGDDRKELVDKVMNVLDEMNDKRIPLIFKYRYIEGGDNNKLQPWSEIAKKLDMSTTGTILLYNIGKRFLYNKMATEGKIYEFI